MFRVCAPGVHKTVLICFASALGTAGRTGEFEIWVDAHFHVHARTEAPSRGLLSCEIHRKFKTEISVNIHMVRNLHVG